MEVKKLEDLQYVATCSVEEAANLVGISRTKAYQIARTGEIFEVVTSGKGIRVKARPLFNKLMGSALDEVTS
jgi:excisionase family DNA binding protein